jgi:hypothetical protein
MTEKYESTYDRQLKSMTEHKTPYRKRKPHIYITDLVDSTTDEGINNLHSIEPPPAMP